MFVGKKSGWKSLKEMDGRAGDAEKKKKLLTSTTSGTRKVLTPGSTKTNVFSLYVKPAMTTFIKTKRYSIRYCQK
jgi:hypothetical protein